jgi:magnesium-transporting ATPase (P-type)
MGFTTLVFSQLALVFAVRGGDPFFRAGRNPALYAAVAASAAVQAAVLGLAGLSAHFDVVRMSPPELAAALGLALLPFSVLEVYKWWSRRAASAAEKP